MTIVFSFLKGERFSRHAGHYSSLPRPPTASKKGVAFGKTPSISAAQSTDYLPVRGVSERCLTTPILGFVNMFIVYARVYLCSRYKSETLNALLSLDLKITATLFILLFFFHVRALVCRASSL